MTPLALSLIGFSLFSALVLAVTHFAHPDYRARPLERAMGLVLLLALCGLQWAHFQLLYLGHWALPSWLYRVLLFTVAPAFYLFSQPLLTRSVVAGFRPAMLLHLLPLAAAAFVADGLALPLAFVVGAGYLLWLARVLYGLRLERASFRLEMVLLGSVFVIAMAVSVLGIFRMAVTDAMFFSLYASAIGLAFVLVQITLGLRPQLANTVAETVQTSYAVSSLKQVDCEAVLTRLGQLMQSERIYEQQELSLPVLADRLELSSHQLSELLNARLGKRFSRYLREQRVQAAKAMLLDEPGASVLSVGLSVGFTSQSNFYEAFREIEGTTPAQFRKLKVGLGGQPQAQEPG